MRVLLDEDVHVRVLTWLTQQGYDAVRVPSGLKNGDVVELARREQRVLITRDKDFSNRLMYPPRKFRGIVVLRIHPPLLEKLVSALQLFLAEVSDVALAGKTAIIEKQGYRLLS